MTLFQSRSELPDTCAMYTASSLKPERLIFLDHYHSAFWHFFVYFFGNLASAAWIFLLHRDQGGVFPKILHECLSLAQLAQANIPRCERGWTVPPMQFACKWRGEVWTELCGSIRECIKGGTQKFTRIFFNHISVAFRVPTLETSTYGYKREKGRIVM